MQGFDVVAHGREHAADWVPLLRWIANPTAVPAAAPALQASLA